MSAKNENKKDISICILSFFIYSLLIWCGNNAATWATTPSESWTLSGFLHGPYAPFSGFCVIGVMNIFYFIGSKWKEINPTAFLLIFLTFLLIGITEYTVSFFYELLWNSVPWDYGNLPLNLNGRTCIGHLTAITIFEVLCVYVIQPFLDNVLCKIPSCARYIAAFSLTALIIGDFAVTMIY